MRVLLDTNILARAASGPPGLANEIVVELARAEHTIIGSPFLLAELSRVLRYDRLRPIHALDDAGIDQYVSDLRDVGELVLPPLAAPSVARDPQDDPIVAAGVAGRAEVLCTKDRHLFAPEVVAYCQQHQISVQTDLELIARLRSSP